MSNQNNLSERPLYFSNEYLDWLVVGYDKNGTTLSFQGIKYW